MPFRKQAMEIDSQLTRLCLLGEFQFDRLASSWERAFRANGVEVVRFDVNEALRHLHWIVRNRYSHRLTIRSYPIRRWAAQKYNQAIFDAVKRSGVKVLVIHNGSFVFPETIVRLQSVGVKVVVFHADNPFPPHYNNFPETLPVAKASDLYLIWSEQLVVKLREAGVKTPYFLPFAWDTEVFPYVPPSDDPWPGVLFVGGWDREREEFLNRIAEKYPLRIYGPGYWGSRTQKDSLARQCWMGGELTGSAAAKVIRESAISLNILRTQHIIDGAADGLIMRHFEVPGAGGFLLSTRSGGASRLFPDGESAGYFDGVEECISKIGYYLSNPAHRQEIAERAHRRVAEKHCYADRMREVMLLLDGMGG